MLDVELVIFDLAGTTVEDSGQVPEAFRAALAEHGISVSPKQLRAVRGASKRQAVFSFIPEGPDRDRRGEEAYAAFRARLAQLYKKGVRPIPGAEQTFCWLREKKIRAALNTGFDRDTTGLLLGELGWDRGTADAIICGDDVTQGRPAPYLIFRAMEAAGATSVHRVMNVGDTALDLKAAQNAGVRYSIGVLSGAHSRAQLEEIPHTNLIASVADLPDLWRIA